MALEDQHPPPHPPPPVGFKILKRNIIVSIPGDCRSTKGMEAIICWTELKGQQEVGKVELIIGAETGTDPKEVEIRKRGRKKRLSQWKGET